MMMVFKRKEILVSALVILIGAAAVVNYSYEKKDVSEKSIQTNTSAIESRAQDYSVSAIDDSSNSEGKEKMMGEAQQVNAGADEKADYFSQAKLNRESARSKKIEILNQMISSAQTDEQTKADAQKDLLAAANASDTEAVCENLIVAKGFESAVVFINDNSATVTVKAENFNDEAAAKIQEIVASNAGIETKYIKIVAV